MNKVFMITRIHADFKITGAQGMPQPSSSVIGSPYTDELCYPDPRSVKQDVQVKRG